MTQVYSGRYGLAKEGRIHLEITIRFDLRIRKSQRNSVLCIPVLDSGNDRKRTVCFDMLADPRLADRMRRENYRYYLDEVDPSVLVYKRLKAAIRLPEVAGQIAVA